MTIATPNPQIRESRARRITVFRNYRWCGFWAILVAISCAFIANQYIYVQLPALLCTIYTLQALVAEYMGVRVSVDWVSAPRRLPGTWAPRQAPGIWPIAVLWRSYGTPSEIEGVTSLSAEGPGVVEIQWMRGSRVWLLLSDRDGKLAFFEALRRYRPQVRIFREVRKHHDYRENRPDLA